MGFDEQEVNERVTEAMRLAGLPEEFGSRSPFDLSGGQKRRCAIAGVLAMRPKVLVLDEPTAGLDPAGRDEILGAIVELHKQAKDMTVIFVSHSMEDVANIAKHVIVMNDGHVALTGTVREVFSHSEELEAMGLDVPEITRLFKRLGEFGIDVPPDIFTVRDACEYLVNRIKGVKGNV
jgi:energy-coupling factor transport system ATP-binding protein